MPRSSIASIPSSPGVSYNIFSQPTAFTFGSGDSDSFNYDSNTGRMTQYQYTVGTTPQTVTGNLTWNANGTLGQLAITDQLNSANTQTCNYAHDDLVRIASVTCSNNPTNIWGQTFGYDPLGNLSKFLVNGYPGTSFTPTYSTSTNRVTSSPFTYDANGNTLTDNAHSYTWDAEGKVITADSITLIYDAMGRVVEQNGTTQIVYAPTGQKFALMNGQTLTKAFVPLPAGAVAVYDSSGAIAYYRHADWLGSSRLSTTPGRTVYSSLAYAPFGETYAEMGTPDRSFTGQNQDTIANGTTGLYDFLYREYAQYGRWISPDPAGMAAGVPANPQSWNRYAYIMNAPLMFADPTGLRWEMVCPAKGPCMYYWTSDASDKCGTDGCELTPLTSSLSYSSHLLLCSGHYGGSSEGPGHFTGCVPVAFPNPPSRSPDDASNFTCHDLAAGKTPSGNFSNWLAGYVNANNMFDAWLEGWGNTSTDFGPNSPESQQMLGAYNLSANVAAFLAGGKSSGFQNFGLRGLLASGINPTAQFVGSYGWSMNLSGGYLNITLTNATTAYSFFYHSPGLNPNSSIRPSTGWHPMGRVNQIFHIQVPCP